MANIGDIRAAVRALMPNETSATLIDNDLIAYIEQALRRLSHDSPSGKSARITGDGGNYYLLTTILADWVEDDSVITKIIQIAPVIADDGRITTIPPDDYDVLDDGTGEFLRLVKSLSSTDDAIIDYTVPWTVEGASGEPATTLPARHENALTYLSTAVACYAKATEASGTTSSNLPGDLINYRTKQREYRDMGREWEKQYRVELGLEQTQSIVAAGMSRSKYPTSNQFGTQRMTHHSWR